MSRNRKPSASGRSPYWATYRRILAYAYPYRKRLFVGLLFGMLFGGSIAGALVSLRAALVQVFGGDSTVVTRLVEEALAGKDSSTWVTVGILLLLPLMVLLRGVGFFLSKYCVEWVGHRVVMDLRDKLFTHLNDLSVEYISHSRTGELISRTTNDTQMVERAVSSVVGDLIREPFALIAGMSVLLMIDARLAAISLVAFPLFIVPVAFLGRRVRRFSREGQAYIGDLASIQQEAVIGARIVKAFGMEDFEKAKFFSRCHSVFRRHIKITIAKAAVTPVIEFSSVIGACLVLVYAGHTGLSMDRLITFLGALIVLYDPAKKLSRVQLAIQQSAGAADRVFEILDPTWHAFPQSGREDQEYCHR